MESKGREQFVLALSATRRLIPNANPCWLDDPETRFDPLRCKRPYCSGEARQTFLDGLIAGSQHDDSRRTQRIVAAGVGEVEIQRDQNAPLSLTGALYSRVLCPKELRVGQILNAQPCATRGCRAERGIFSSSLKRTTLTQWA